MRGTEEAFAGLRRVIHEVRSVGLGDETSYEAGALVVSPSDAGSAFTDPALADVRVSWASPGERVRIVKVLDVVEPRTKGPRGGGIFPGWLGPARPQGHGETHVLRGAAVVVAGFLPRAQEAVIDLAGPAADLSPFGSTHDLVVEFEPAAGAAWERVEEALRRGALALAARLAEAALDAPPDGVEELPLVSPGSGDPRLPRVGAITNLQTQGAFKDVFVYGRTFASSLPTLIDPTELEDGAVVSGQYGHPGLRNPTYLHQNHPVIAALRARDGADLRLAGLVIAPEPIDQALKELVSAHAARLCAAAGFDAVVVTKEGGGNADADIALKMDALEEIAIPTVGLFAEMAGSEGVGAPLVVSPTRASATISTGNYDEQMDLPEMERALGGDRLDVAGMPATAAARVPVAIVLGSLNPLGWGRLTASPAA